MSTEDDKLEQSISPLAAKFRRALRNGTGMSVTIDELRQLGRIGALHMTLKAEGDELMAQTEARIIEREGGGASEEISHKPENPTQDPSDGRPFTLSSLANRWSCSSEAIRSMIKRGELAHSRLGKLYRIPAAEVLRVEACGGSVPSR